MKSFVLFAMIFGFSTAHSASVAEIDEQLDKLKANQTNLENNIEKAKNEYSIYGNYYGQKGLQFKKWIAEKVGSDGTKGLEKELSGLQKEASTYRVTLVENESKLKRVNAQIEALNDQRSARVKIERLVRSIGLQGDFSRVRHHINDMEDAIQTVESQIDKTKIGAYVQEKVGLLLNSQVICRAHKRCSGGPPDKINAKQIRAEMFPDSDSIFETRKYYDKLDKTGRRQRSKSAQ